MPNGLDTIPSPIGGINAYDNLAAMPSTDAIRLMNLIPQPYGCTVRKGYQAHATGLGGAVESLASWVNVTGLTKLFGFAAGKMWDVTLPAAVVPADQLLAGLTSNFWQSVSFANSAGAHTVMLNGQDDGIWYKSGGITRLTLGDGVVAGTWKNVNPAQLIQATVHQRRIWAVQVDSTLGWFLPPDSVYGVANFFDFGPLFKRGGYLAALATWTVDAGGGSNDKLVAISSRGEVVVYAGTDVTNADAWSLAGVYYIGQPPRGRRFFTNVAGDLYILTLTGVISMATVITSTQLNVAANDSYSRKIQFLLSNLLGELSDLEGWEISLFPSQNLLIINVPSVYSGGNGQLVANMINSAWCTFDGMDARCWMNLEDSPYFGDADGTVWAAWIGDRDGVAISGTGGTNVLSSCQQAYTNFGSPTTQKQVGLYRATFLAVRPAGYSTTITYDYKQSKTALANASASVTANAFWNQGIWNRSLWSGGLLTQREWRSGEGLGTAVSLSLNMSTEVETTWVGTDYTYIGGGPL